MGTIESRLRVLERTAADSEQVEQVSVFILPEEGDPDRPRIQAEIDALELAGRKVVVIVRANARL